MIDLGKLMYERRKELHLTLEEVGDAVGVGKSTVRKWENGSIKNMGRDKIALLAKVLQLDPVIFVPSDDSVPFTTDELRLVSAYRAADERAQADALDMLLKHSKRPQYEKEAT